MRSRRYWIIYSGIDSRNTSKSVRILKLLLSDRSVLPAKEEEYILSVYKNLRMFERLRTSEVKN